MTKIDLTDIIPAATIMIVSVAASTTTGAPLDEKEVERVQRCDFASWHAQSARVATSRACL